MHSLHRGSRADSSAAFHRKLRMEIAQQNSKTPNAHENKTILLHNKIMGQISGQNKKKEWGTFAWKPCWWKDTQTHPGRWTKVLGLAWQWAQACVSCPWVSMGVVLVYPPLKTLWCQTQWNVFFKASVGRVGARGTSCTLLIAASLLLICRRENLLYILLLAKRRVEGKSLKAQSAQLHSAG